MRQAGSVLKKRNRWYVAYRTETGKQNWEGGFDTKGQAQARLTEILGQIQSGAYVEPSGILFDEFADQWLKNRINISGSTWEGYDSYLKAHIKPELGTMKLKDIKHTHIQNLITRLATQPQKSGKPLSANTVRKMATMLATLFKSAVKNNLIRINPAKELELPKAVKAKIQPPSKEDVLSILREAPVEHQALFLLDCVTGLRRGEVLALQRKHIDWINREACVEQAIKKVRVTDDVHKYSWAVGPTKSGRQRRVGIPPIVLEALQLHLSASKDVSEDQFIFTRNGTFMDPEYFSKWIALPLVKKATDGRVKRFHDLRHFFASVLIENGESPKYIQDQVGHASITTTFDIYGHLMPKAKQEATKRLERSIFGKKASVEHLLNNTPQKQNPDTVN
jgi:integrase